MSKWYLHLVLLTLLASAALAQSSPFSTSRRKLTGPEKELIEICEGMQSDFEHYYSRADELKDDAERDKFLAENDPSPKYISKLAEYERSHHGTHAGLMAARQLILEGVRVGEVGSLARRHILSALLDYADAPEWPDIVRYLRKNDEPETETFLRQLTDTDASDENRAFARYVLANWSFTMRDKRDWLERRIKELNEGALASFPNEKKDLLQNLSSALSPAKLAALEKEATETLESLCR